MKKIVINAVVFTLVLPVTILAADTMHEGRWELTTTMEMQGMPMKMPATMKNCKP